MESSGPLPARRGLKRDRPGARAVKAEHPARPSYGLPCEHLDGSGWPVHWKDREQELPGLLSPFGGTLRVPFLKIFRLDGPRSGSALILSLYRNV